MTKVQEFLHGADTHFGVFYPQGCILLTFPSYGDAAGARQSLLNRGYCEKDVIAVSGPEALEFANEYVEKHGLWGRFMTEVSRIFDTEAPYADHDLTMARRGAGFLAVHAPTERHKKEAWAILEPLNPIHSRYYASAGVEHLAGEY